jgi:hypothetical protein
MSIAGFSSRSRSRSTRSRTASRAEEDVHA